MKYIKVIIFLFFSVKIYSVDITVVVNHTPPFRIIENKNYTGIYIDIIKELAKIKDYNYIFVEVPFARGLKMMEEGSADIMLGPLLTPERELYMEYLKKVSLPRANKVFYFNSINNLIKDYSDLLGKQIAVMRDVSYFKRFDEDKSLNKIEINDYFNALRMVEANRVDVAIMPEQTGDYLLLIYTISLKKSPFIINGDPCYITVSRKSPFIEYANEFEEALQSLEKSGKINNILNRYKPVK